MIPISFVSKDNNGDLNGACLDFNLWEELMEFMRIKKIQLSSDVSNLQGKLFGVGKQIAIFN